MLSITRLHHSGSLSGIIDNILEVVHYAMTDGGITRNRSWSCKLHLCRDLAALDQLQHPVPLLLHRTILALQY